MITVSLPTTRRLTRLLTWCAVLLAMPMAYMALRHAGDLRRLLGDAGLAAGLCGTLGVALALGIRWASDRQLASLLVEQRASQLRFHTAINNITLGLCFFDGRQRLIVCNDRYAEMYRLPRQAVRAGTTLKDIVDMRYAAGTCPAMSPAEYLHWRAKIAGAQRASDTVTTLQDGRIFAIHHEPMNDGGWVATHEDITEQRRAQAQIERMARHDALTGLPNRLFFRERLDEAVQRIGTGQSLAVLFVDLDRFKAVNDTLGHPVGDALLRAAAQRLRECVRPGDLVARLGGDEFAIIQIDAPQPVAAQSLADRLVHSITEAFEIGDHQVLVGGSVGVVLSPEHGSDPDDLLQKADLALYDAKSAGRGTYRVFMQGMVEQAQQQRALETDLRQALAHGELELHYQPIVCLRTLKTVTMEALLRWRHPRRGLVMPDRFIPLAEETGLIEPLGAWVLGQAFEQALLWPAHVNVAVNLSPRQFASGKLVGAVTSALQDSGLAPGRVELEITESVRLAEDAVNLGILHQLHSLGVRISLDDFGVGYSSLSYLRSFPFKKIKIDRSFVRDVDHNAEARAIVTAITHLGNSLKMTITAEGVETAAQLFALREMGCDEAQGYYLSRPQPAHEALQAFLPEPRMKLVAGGS